MLANLFSWFPDFMVVGLHANSQMLRFMIRILYILFPVLRPVREFDPPSPHQATLTKSGRPHIFDTGDSPDINACHC